MGLSEIRMGDIHLYPVVRHCSHKDRQSGFFVAVLDKLT